MPGRWNLYLERTCLPPEFDTLKVFMSKLLEGKFALILGIANKWSLAYAIAQAFSREGATLGLTYLGERQKDAIEDLSRI